MLVYRIEANLEKRFASLREAQCAYSSQVIVRPWIPKTLATKEDSTIQRIPVCLNLKDCVSAIGLIGRFRRCLAANEDAKTYVERGDHEVSPIIIRVFKVGEDGVYNPTGWQVPDVLATNERWLLTPHMPVTVKTVWLDAYSILMEEVHFEYGTELVCTSLHYYEQVPFDGVHPWVNGEGHILDSSRMDYEEGEEDDSVKLMNLF